MIFHVFVWLNMGMRYITMGKNGKICLRIDIRLELAAGWIGLEERKMPAQPCFLAQQALPYLQDK